VLTDDSSGFDWWNLTGQVQHKLAYISDHLQSRRRLILIGHSIGCYMILKMLSSKVENSFVGNGSRHQVMKCCLLFPTIERMSQSPSGRKATPLLKYFYWFIPFVVYPLCYFVPHTLKRFLVERHFGIGRVAPCAIDATLKLASPRAIINSAYLGRNEMESVQEPDLETISEHLDKLFFYYGANDHWCPVEYHHQMKDFFPKGHIQLCRHDIEHAFCLSSSDQMASIVHSWLCANGGIRN
jgi:Lipid-droplet associated hydrolase